MRKSLLFIFLIFWAFEAYPQTLNGHIDTICVKEKVLNYDNVIWKTNTYSLIKSEYPDSIVVFAYLNGAYPNGTYTFSIKKGAFNLISAPEEDSSIKCVDTVKVKINGTNENVFKYEPRGFIFDGEGCIIFSKKYGIIASGAYSHKVKRLVTEWNGITLKLDTLLNYKSINVLGNNRYTEQPPK